MCILGLGANAAAQLEKKKSERETRAREGKMRLLMQIPED